MSPVTSSATISEGSTELHGTGQSGLTAESARFLYDQTAHDLRHFLDWRQRVLNVWLTVSSGLLAVSAWMYDHDLGNFIVAPWVYAGLFSFLAVGLNERIQTVLEDHYCDARRFARMLGAQDGRPLESIRLSRPSHVAATFRYMLDFAYALVGTSFWLAAVLYVAV
jgi:hypothetical protein